MKLVNLDGGWKMIYSEVGKNRILIWDISGNGTTLVLPPRTVELRTGAISKKNCPNLKKVYIPNFVETIAQAGFDGFGTELEVTCQKTGQPVGYFEGEYVHRYEEDGAPYYVTHRGNWLHHSVLLRSEDSEGRLTWSAGAATALCAVQPKVRWGVEPENF